MMMACAIPVERNGHTASCSPNIRKETTSTKLTKELAEPPSDMAIHTAGAFSQIQPNYCELVFVHSLSALTQEQEKTTHNHRTQRGTQRKRYENILRRRTASDDVGKSNAEKIHIYSFYFFVHNIKLHDVYQKYLGFGCKCFVTKRFGGNSKRLLRSSQINIAKQS